MDVSVIIVNYNTKSLLKDCLNSIFEKTIGIEFEIIIVDNASIDGSQEMVKKEFAEVTLIENDENLGFGRANNIGAKVSRGRFLFFLNSDTMLIENSIKILLNFYESSSIRKKIGVIGCLLFDKNYAYSNSYGQFPSFSNILKSRINHYLNVLYPNRKQKTQLITDISYINVDYVSGADLFIPRIIFEYLNGFSDKYFLYYEETDLQKRMETLNLERIVIFFTKIIHIENGTINSQKKFSHQKRMLFLQSENIFLKNNYPFIFFTLKIINILFIIPTVFNKKYKLKENFEFLQMMFKIK
jgi:GT2 family glycosyltransferase